MKNSMRCWFILLALFVGCGNGGVERHNISGTATFDGQPIVYGQVEFISKHGQGVDAPSGTAGIRDGKYDTSIDGQGVVAGPYELLVTAYPTKLPETDDETSEVAEVEPIFFNYAIEATLTPPTFNIEVPPDAEGHGLGGSSKRRNDP